MVLAPGILHGMTLTWVQEGFLFLERKLAQRVVAGMLFEIYTGCNLADTDTVSDPKLGT